MCPGGLCEGGLCPGGSLSKGGLSRVGKSLSRGFSVRETPHLVISWRYASYWNAFLFVLCFHVLVLCLWRVHFDFRNK